MKYYTGIGSRETPEETLNLMGLLAKRLVDKGYTLRSGGAKGADAAFEWGVDFSSNPAAKEIYRPEDAKPWAYDYVEKYCMPSDRKGYANWKPYVKGLLARNMMQVLGTDGQTPVEFVICWTPGLDYSTSAVGGTGYAIRCALHNNIPVYNLYDKDDVLKERVKSWKR